jgi:hypothetical protein
MAVKNIFLKCPKSGGAGAPPATMAPPPLERQAYNDLAGKLRFRKAKLVFQCHSSNFRSVLFL